MGQPSAVENEAELGRQRPETVIADEPLIESTGLRGRVDQGLWIQVRSGTALDVADRFGRRWFNRQASIHQCCCQLGLCRLGNAPELQVAPAGDLDQAGPVFIRQLSYPPEA